MENSITSNNYNYDSKPDKPYFQSKVDTRTLFQYRYRYLCACKAVWGVCVFDFDDKTPEQIEQFLSIYFDKRIVLTAVEKSCNENPIWTFHFQQVKDKLFYFDDNDKNFSLLSLDPRLFAYIRLG